jgi:hypothetical protein
MTRRGGWDFTVGKLIDDAVGTIRLLAVFSLCFALGTAIFGLARPEVRSEAMSRALVMAVFGVLSSAFWALLARWRKARHASRRPASGRTA